jgi:two-component system chemotaxis response regulator CheB
MTDHISKRHQFLFVDDDPVFLGALTTFLKQLSKANWAFRTATNHSQALEHLKAQPVDLIVLDIEMPVMDGIEFLRLLQRTHPGQKVVMLSARLDENARKQSMELGAALFLEKPNSRQGFDGLFAALEALVASGPTSGFRGVMQVGLQDVLQMECLSRKSSILRISAGGKGGQIFISNGEIIHAECGQLQGEMALYGLLGYAQGEFSLQPFTEPPRRTVTGQHEFLLMEAARLRDENSTQPDQPGSFAGSDDLPGSFDEAAPKTEARGVRIEETLLCSRAGEVLFQSNCEAIEKRLELFKKLEEQATLAAKGTASGRFHRVSMDLGQSRLVVQLQPTYKLLVRSALPAPALTTNE